VTRRFRPILRMHDLTYYPNKNQRIKAIAEQQEEAIGQYSLYSKIWAPSQLTRLLVVKVPRSMQQLTEELYALLMQQRLSWMLQSWLEAVSNNPFEIQDWLEQQVAAIASPTEFPLLQENQDLDDSLALMAWREAWAEVILSSDRLSDLMLQENIQFQQEPISRNHPNFRELHDLHQDATLEEWLTLFTGA
jgi:hypothetical protein